MMLNYAVLTMLVLKYVNAARQILREHANSEGTYCIQPHSNRSPWLFLIVPELREV